MKFPQYGPNERSVGRRSIGRSVLNILLLLTLISYTPLRYVGRSARGVKKPGTNLQRVTSMRVEDDAHILTFFLILLAFTISVL